jgi:8-oxo-dGTP pyrophosphatase MutT (NUDIX family)
MASWFPANRVANQARYPATSVDSMQELPHRRAARLVVLDGRGRVLLFRHAGNHGQVFWATPGGGLEAGETFEQAAYREASEELGINGITLRFLWEAMNDFVHVGYPVRQRERYFLLEGVGQDLLTGVQAVHEQEGILDTRWWSRAELGATTEPLFPKELPLRLGEISTLGQ